jgi:acyl-CoA thioesterase-1
MRFSSVFRVGVVAFFFAGVWSPAEAQTRIVAFGDSNTYGMNMSRAQAYPSQLEALLRAKGYDVQVTNAGVPGNTTADALARVDSAVPAGTRVAIVLFGVNDARRGIPPATIERNLSEVLARLKARNVSVILCRRRAPFPPGYDVSGYHAVFPRVAQKYGAASCNFTEGIPPAGFHAGGHENATGTAIVANNLLKTVEPMIKGAKKR